MTNASQPASVDAGADELLEEVRDGVGVLTLNRPARLNALNVTICERLQEALVRLEATPEVRAVVLTGAGRAFSSGADLQGAVGGADKLLRDHYNPLVLTMMRLDIPLVAAVNGVAAGAGASLAFACDFRVAAESSRFQLSFVKIGLIPDSGATWLLPRLVGHARALDISMRGRDLFAREAREWGLVTEVTPDGGALDGAVDLARELAALSSSLGATKNALLDGLDRDLVSHLEAEADTQGRVQTGPDFAEARDAFVEKRKPRFAARSVSA
ncbi:1,2-epoxyphenylacetyl-CoA isomerase [Paraconexibacter sp. AEG42_29]|uniref:1,2-epoxyphenylacetyl-CoA isomerase n=1 Tax=Paraconexibacter sp. AEG42_29 TaxID=2997339 RepID=A0AAU7B069_9ACTN